MKPEGICKYKHGSAFDGEQAQRLMKDFHLNQGELRHCLFLPKWEKEEPAAVTTLDTEGQLVCLYFGLVLS